MMKEITDIDGNEEFIRGYIQRLGFMPEHKFEYFKCLTDEGTPTFLYDEDVGFGVMCFFSKEGKSRIVTSLVEPLAPKEKMIEALERFIKFCVEEKGMDKVILETRYEVKLGLAKRLKEEGKGYEVLKERYSMTWPVFIMKNFDENLSGGKWKKIRYFKNKFFKDHDAKVDDFKDEDKEVLKELVMDWVKKRTASDHAAYKRYINMIESSFKGFDMVKVIKVKDKPVSVFGGWKTVMPGMYYSCVGIYDYDYENIGEVSNVIDLSLIKQLGVEKTDLGGGEEALTNFKKKFFPDEFYRTDVYTVLRRDKEKKKEEDEEPSLQ
ncbi:hypothetical protein JW826_01180 [Candidatus Woesearchaeota archaeon]|nr:hypothetical protein [Candidatus Woesearchaeota archaeon]